MIHTLALNPKSALKTLIRIPARAGLYFNLLEILKQNLSRG